MIKTEEEIIFEPGEHIISFRSFFSSDNTVYHDKKRVDINYMTCPEGYELVNVSAFLRGTPSNEELIYTFVNKCKVKVPLYVSLATPGEPVDTVSKRLVKNDLGR